MENTRPLSKQDSTTLAAIFRAPARPVKFRLVQSLLAALGFDMQQGRGSRVKFIRGHDVLTMHTPHPRNELCLDAVRHVRDFLLSINVEP